MALSLAVAVLRRPQPAWRIGVLAAGVTFLILNVFQKFSYQPAWRNGETLWQYHLILPRLNPSSYANLAVYYYADAVAKKGTPEMAIPMRKMSVVVDAGLAEFWRYRQQSPPQETHFLFFSANPSCRR